MTTTTTTTAPTTTPTPPTEPQQLTTGTFGVVEGHPVWWVGVEVGSTVTSVRMTFADGSTDQMAPVGGIAVLARRVSATVASADTGPYVVRGTLQLLDSAGNVVNTVTLPEQSAPVPSPAPVPAPAPVPLPGPVAQGPQAAATPGAIFVCPQPAKGAAQAQSSTTTEKR